MTAGRRPDARRRHGGIAVLGIAGRASRWAIGDLLVALGKRYGETYVAEAEATGYRVQTLKNMA
jgi:hypothetical protein